MKRIIIKLVLSVIALMATTQVSAYDFEVDGIYYNAVSLADLTAEVTRGDAAYTIETINIPETVTYMGRTFSVIRIGYYAFVSCSSTSVIIPESVTSIGVGAFRASSLLSIIIPKNVTSIGERAFWECAALSSVAILGNVISIGEEAFRSCDNLSSITIPESMESIIFNKMAFYNCNKLEAITIPENAYVGEQAFSYCEGLKSIIIKSDIQNQNSYHPTLFHNDTSVEYINISANVNKVGNYVFDNISFKNTLKEVIIDDSDQELYLGYSREAALHYRNCFYSSKLEKIYLGRNLSYNHKEENDFYYYDYYAPFYYSAREVYIGDKVTSIDRLFLNRGCETLVVGKGLSEIPNMSGWSSLTSLTLTSEVPQTAMGFSDSQYINLKVYVPKGSLAAYQSADVWKNFWNLQEVETTGINHIIKNGEATKEVKRYDTLGREINSSQKGLNIIKMNDGTTKKVIVK